MQLTLHDANLKILGWIDNVTYDTLSYSDDLLTKDLPTGASTYRLKIPKRKIKSDLGNDYLYKALNERAWITFTHRGKVYLFNVRDVIGDRTQVELYCENLNMELLNENANPYSSSEEQTFAQYCEAMALLKYSFLKIGRNEISNEKMTLEFPNRETKLARIIALARAFNAEFEFTVRLNPNSTIKDFTLDVYHGHDDRHHGVGTKRNDLVLNYSNGLGYIRRKVSKKNIFNMIVPTGKRSNSTKNKKTVTNNPDGTKTITEKITNDNGYVTTVTKVDVSGKILSKKTVTAIKNNNGTVSKSTSQNTSGSVSTSNSNTTVVTNPDQSTTRTTTTKRSDGTVEKTIVHTKIDKYPDKSTKTTTTTTKPDGSVTERVSWRYANGTSNTTTRVVKPGKSSTTSVVTKVDEANDEEFDLSKMPDWSKNNKEGIKEFYKRGAALYAPISAQLYPSTFTSETGKFDQWTRRDMEFEADSEEELNGKALAELEKYCYPEITYEIDGYIDADIGDTVTINDTGFDNMLIITARITKQQISFMNPKANKTEIANVRAVERLLSSGMQDRLSQIIEEAKPYTIHVTTDNGVMFKNSTGTSLVTPVLTKGVKEYPEATWRFTLNGETTVGLEYLVNANQIGGTQVLTIAAYIGNDEVATHQLTFVNVADGPKGPQGPQGEPGPKGDDGAGSRNFSEDYLFKRGLWYYTQGDSSAKSIEFSNGVYRVSGTTTTWKQLQIVNESGKRVHPSQLFSTALDDLIPGEPYTLSFKARCISGNPEVWICLRDNLLGGGTVNRIDKIFTLTNEWAVYSATTANLIATDNFDFRRIILGYSKVGTVEFKEVELVIGSKRYNVGPAVEDLQARVESKADSQLTQEQLLALTDQTNRIQANMEALAAAKALTDLEEAYKEYVRANDAAKKVSESELATLKNRTAEHVTKLAKFAEDWEFMTTKLRIAEEGIYFGKLDGSSEIKITDDRISFWSSEKEVMWITAGVLNIDNGIFTVSVQIGRFREEQYTTNPDINVIRYVG